MCPLKRYGQGYLLTATTLHDDFARSNAKVAHPAAGSGCPECLGEKRGQGEVQGGQGVGKGVRVDEGGGGGRGRRAQGSISVRDGGEGHHQ